MAFVIQMPKLGHTMTEGTVIQWHKRPGESIREGESVMTVETDKAQVEIEAPNAGVLGKQIAAEGVVVAVGGPLGVIVAEGEAVPAEFDNIVNGAKAESSASANSASSNVKGAQPKGASKRVIASPRAKRLAAERGIDIAALTGSGPDGMITEDDVKSAKPAPAATASNNGDSGPPTPSHREKLTRIQAVGARNLAASWSSVPHFVQMVRVDMSRALAARKALNQSGVQVSITDVILAATVRALKENPHVNASYADGERLIYESVGLGVAVDTPEGLIVPVLHDADRLDLPSLSAKVTELAERARNRQLRPADLEGATFTVSNLGAYGIENGTPVIFAPQMALMFVGAIRDQVLAIDGKPVVRPAMNISIAYDHRGIDGATASRFTTRVKALLEAGDFGASDKVADAIAARPREVSVEAIGDSLRTRVSHGSISWQLSAEDSSGVDPVTAFLGALGSCLLMSLRVAARARKLDVGHASVIARSNEKGHVKEVEVELKVESAATDEQLHRLIEVAERGCHIRQLVRDDVAFKLKVERLS